MQRQRRWIAALVFVAAGAAMYPPAAAPDASEGRALVRIRPATLAEGIDLFAGQPVEVSGARIVGMFGARVLVIDSTVRLQPASGRRDRILVLIENAEIRVSPELLADAAVRVTGVARTLLGVRMTGEVPWPVELDRDRLDRLEIRAAVLATSVQTAEGVELATEFAVSGSSTRSLREPE